MRKLVADSSENLRGNDIPVRAGYEKFAAQATNGGVLPASWIVAGDGGGTPAVSGSEPATGSADAEKEDDDVVITRVTGPITEVEGTETQDRILSADIARLVFGNGVVRINGEDLRAVYKDGEPCGEATSFALVVDVALVTPRMYHPTQVAEMKQSGFLSEQAVDRMAKLSG